jgi:hypothetical protein
VALDRELPNLGRYSAARRVARTVFLGSAPTLRSAHRGIEAQRVRLGCALPGESVATFGDVLKRLTDRATYLYVDGARHWYGVQPSVARLARDRAERLRLESLDSVHAEIVRWLRTERERGAFAGVHVAPRTSAEVPDEPEVRLVVLHPETPYVARSDTSPALTAAAEMLDRRGTAARSFRNTLVFLAADQRRLEELERGAAEYLAWRSIDDDRAQLNLDGHQQAQATTKRGNAERAVRLRIAETYSWALVPTQPNPTGPVEWEAVRVEGQLPLAGRASRRLLAEAHLYQVFAPALLRMQLDGLLASLWSEGHVSVRELWQTFARYLYLPRLLGFDVLAECVRNGPAALTWTVDGFATADASDDASGRFLGLTAGAHPAAVQPDTLVVSPARAQAQLEAQVSAVPDDRERRVVGATGPESRPSHAVEPRLPDRFYGVVELDPARLIRDFGKVSQEVIQHLTELVGAEVTVTVEVKAKHPGGFGDRVVRIVSENAHTLGFTAHEFE